MLTDNSPMPSGRFKGRSLIEVPAPYLLKLFEGNTCNPELKAYIIENRNALLAEIKARPAEVQMPDNWSENRWQETYQNDFRDF